MAKCTNAAAISMILARGGTEQDSKLRLILSTYPPGLPPLEMGDSYTDYATLYLRLGGNGVRAFTNWKGQVEVSHYIPDGKTARGLEAWLKRPVDPWVFFE